MVEELVKMVEHSAERRAQGARGFGYEVVRTLIDYQCLLRGIMCSRFGMEGVMVWMED
jgi:hypothetical protein